MAARDLEHIPRIADRLPSRPVAGTAVLRRFSAEGWPGRKPAMTRTEVAHTLVRLTASDNQCSLCSLCTA